MTTTAATTPTIAHLCNARRTLTRKYPGPWLVTDRMVWDLAQDIARLEAAGVTGLGTLVSR